MNARLFEYKQIERKNQNDINGMAMMSDSSLVMFKVFIKEKFEGEMWRRMAVPQEIWVYHFKEIGTVETLYSDQ